MSFWSDPIRVINEWLTGLLASLLPEAWATLLSNVIGVVAVSSFGLILVIFLIWLERKVAARFQDRIGPNRAGPYGLLQTIADIVKLLTKEDSIPEKADKITFNLAPIISMIAVLLIWAVVPFAPGWIGTDLNVGVLYIAAVGSFGILSILMAGWSSNNKYALLGAFRAVAQLISYEVPMLLTLLVPVLLARSMGMVDVVQDQSVWFIALAPLAGIIFLVSSIAEVGRTPFDLIEAESEIVAGYHTEYTGMKFGLFFAAEFLHAFTVGVLFAILFLGGWRGPGAEQFPILGVLYLMAKSTIGYFIVMWVRSTLPRIRIDHMLDLNWKVLTPVALALLIITAVLDKLFSETALRVPALLAGNLVVLALAWAIIRLGTRRARRERKAFKERPEARAA
ncbi:MAG: NADH-quinone oxidoreductase subunit NuoH [Anaerolineales bacterium]|jgi:NADH-quinone oxidoreductase subunit H|nr:NADH-quinone oxidoreductase subunit NuoH [Anaerolineales bacterium]MBX3005245.1 NADH-quinone oxidoreductase subunit NuoH [Anaerolineales bacterium]